MLALLHKDLTLQCAQLDLDNMALMARRNTNELQSEIVKIQSELSDKAVQHSRAMYTVVIPKLP